MTTILAEAKALGATAKGYRLGDEGPDYYDCSGLVYAAAKAVGVYDGFRFTTYTIRESDQFTRIASVAADVDDIVVWSENSAHGHMGVISGPDQFYSARSVADGLGYNRISTFHVYPVGPAYYRPVKSDGARHGAVVRDLMLRVPQTYGADVRAVQKIVGVADDGYYGPKTVAAVKTWQAAHHLDADGIVGPLTRQAMGL